MKLQNVMKNLMKRLKRLWTFHNRPKTGQGTITIDGVTYDSVSIWRMLAKEALDIAEQQEWFEIHED